MASQQSLERVIRVLVADDDEVVRRVVTAEIRRHARFEIVGEARSGLEAVDRALELRPDVVAMDVTMESDRSGIEATRLLANHAEEVNVVIVSAREELDVIIEAVEAGARGFVLKHDREHLQIALEAAASGRSSLSVSVTRPVIERLVELFRQEREIIRSTVEAFALIVEKRDEGTGDHSRRVAKVALRVLERMQPGASADQYIEYGFLLHDMGKVNVSDSVLLKPAPLTPEEWALMRVHPSAGAEILRQMPERFHPAIPIVRHHHERFDGAGYPDGLRGEAIPLPCRAFAVVDTFDAMTADRPYRAALPREVALEEIERHRGSQFDPDAVDAFFELVASHGADELG